MKLFKMLSLAVISSSLMMAASSYAQALPATYTSTNGVVVVTINDAVKIQFLPTEVVITYSDGNTGYMTITDANSVLANKIKNNSYFFTNFVQATSLVNTFYNPSMFKTVVCTSNQTTIRYLTGAGEYFTDNCALYQAIKARSN